MYMYCCVFQNVLSRNSMFNFDPVAERSICIFVPKCLLPRPVTKLYVYNLNEIQLNILTHNTKINWQNNQTNNSMQYTKHNKESL